MGLLDDAIREHLDLKRRRGADPGEVERAEREALGPVRRVQAPEDVEIDEGAELGEPDDEVAYDPDQSPATGPAFDHQAEDDESWTFEDELGAPGAPAGAHEAPHEPAFEPPESVGQETAVHRPDFLDAEDYDEPEFEPRRGEVPPPHPAHHGADNPPEQHPADRSEEDGEELLEETPEFLQDTPDHDRLWFEQRPPKDFDFDG